MQGHNKVSLQATDPHPLAANKKRCFGFVLLYSEVLLNASRATLRPNLVCVFALGECLRVAYDSSEAFDLDARECDEAMMDMKFNLEDYVEMVVKDEVAISVNKASIPRKHSFTNDPTVM